MTKHLKFAFACLCCVLLLNTVKAQTAQKDTINVGTVTGLLRDSLHNYVMQSATIAIYKVKGLELVNYQLSSTFGRYEFKNIPVGVPLRAIVTHVGYNSAMKDFTISPQTKKIDLKTINVERIDLSLKEVRIVAAQPPMQVHGDTLEFYASAIKLDSNAVVGDMLRKLPGVTVWADGVITVNGKPINQLLVEGKKFFNGDNKVALDNIPKNSVQKIQVYHNKDDKNSIVPKTDMNIVLKKDKKDGLFGKFGVGYGTDKHSAADGMITYYSPKTQLSVVGAANNVNKTANSVGELMNFNSFKGEGINNDFHSDFSKQGLNVFRGGGATFSQDFSKDADPRNSYYKTNMLRGEAFTSDANNKTIRQSLTYISLGSAGNQTQVADQTSNSDNFNLHSNANYEKRFMHGYLKAELNDNSSHGTSQSNQTTMTSNDQTSDQSRDIEQQNATRSSTNASGSIYLSSDRYYDFSKRKNKSLSAEFRYNFNVDRGTDNSKNITDFTATDATQNKYFNRQYLKDWNGTAHSIVTTLRDITPLIHKGNQFLHIDISNEINFQNKNSNDNVSDLAAGATNYTTNTALTNIAHYRTVDEKPSIKFSKNLTRYLDDRFFKSWSISVSAQDQAFSQTNTALQTFQNTHRLSKGYSLKGSSWPGHNNHN